MPLDIAWPFPHSLNSKLWKLRSKLTMATIGFTGKVFMDYLTKLTVHNREKLLELVNNRPKGTPLITVTNHHSCIDEPFLWGMLQWSQLGWNNGVMRWPLGAVDVVFKTKFNGQFFSLGRTIPVVRGDGVFQRGMDFAIDRLNEGQWVHVYPEAKINEKKEDIRYKWGVGRLIQESKNSPIVLPFYHFGMDDVLPNNRPYRLKLFKKVTILVGNQIDFTESLAALKNSNASQIEIRSSLTASIQEEMTKLREQCRTLHYTK